MDNIRGVNSGQSRDSRPSLSCTWSRVCCLFKTKAKILSRVCLFSLFLLLLLLVLLLVLLLLLLSLSAALAGHQADRKTDVYRESDSRIDETSKRNSLKLRLVLSQFHQWLRSLLVPIRARLVSWVKKGAIRGAKKI